MSISCLPEDLLVLVLVRLEPKSVCRVKIVSKSWNVLISSPEFVMLHVNQSSTNQKPNILVWDILPQLLTFNGIHVAEFSITGKNLELGFKTQRLHHRFEGASCQFFCLLMKKELPLTWKDSYTGLDDRILPSYYVGSCNGLLCHILVHLHFTCTLNGPAGYYQFSEDNISLCNPLTKSSWVLPKRPLVLNEEHKKRRIIISFYGFGYDDVHDDYKVMVANHPDEECLNHLNDVYEYEYEVYSLRSNSWCRVRSHLDFRYHCIKNYDPNVGLDGVLVNCALHWISIDNHSGENSILAFDLRTDKHKFLPVPDVLKHLRFRLNVLDSGCLVLSKEWLDASEQANQMHRFDIWVMKDYGRKDSWTRIAIRNMPCDGFYLTPVSFLESNKRKVIIFYDFVQKGVVLLYDLATQQVLNRVRFSIHNNDVPNLRDCSHHNTRQPFFGSLVQPYPPFSVNENA